MLVRRFGPGNYNLRESVASGAAEGERLPEILLLRRLV